MAARGIGCGCCPGGTPHGSPKQVQPRFHHQLLPDNVIEFEASKYPASMAADLTQRGWIMLDGVSRSLTIEALQVVRDTPVPVHDPRSSNSRALVTPTVELSAVGC